jgi:hypothetical protein
VIAKTRKERQNVRKYKALLATPGVGAITLPANATLAVKSVAGCAAGTTAATIVASANRTIKTPLLAAGGRVKLDRVSRGAVITPATGFELHLCVGLGKFRKIGQG